uniref:Uncharacterized protein n=1 Tax=viral metagenome TaxID=1070528 RepID=A0A6C0M1W3_9ZZZZ
MDKEPLTDEEVISILSGAYASWASRLYTQFHGCATCHATLKDVRYYNLCLTCAREVAPNATIQMIYIKDVMTIADCHMCSKRNVIVVMMPVCPAHIT